jgi:hypothetical protein
VERVRRDPSFLPPVLISESAEEQKEILRALEQEIKPSGIIEKMYVADNASMVFETLRLRRALVGIINTNFRAALQDVLARLLRKPGVEGSYLPEEAEVLAMKWFSDKDARERVSQILRQFHLDKSVIEAEAIRRSAADLERLERMLSSLEVRRNRALYCVAEYRASLAKQLRESTDRIIERKRLPWPGQGSVKKPAA